MRLSVRILCTAATALIFSFAPQLALSAEPESFVVPSTYPANVVSDASPLEFRAIIASTVPFDANKPHGLTICDIAVAAEDTTITPAYVHASLSQYAFSGDADNCTATLTQDGAVLAQLGSVTFTNDYPITSVTQFFPTFYDARATTAVTRFVATGAGFETVSKVVVSTQPSELSLLAPRESLHPTLFALATADTAADCTNPIVTATTITCTLPTFPAHATVPRLLTVAYQNAAGDILYEHSLEATPADAPVDYAPSAVAPATLQLGVPTKLTVTFPAPVPVSYPWSAVLIDAVTNAPVPGAVVAAATFAADRKSAVVEVTAPLDASLDHKFVLSLGQVARVPASTTYSYIDENDQEVFFTNAYSNAEQTVFNAAAVAHSKFELTPLKAPVLIGDVFPGFIHAKTLKEVHAHVQINFKSGVFPQGGGVTVNGVFAAVVSASPLIIDLRDAKLAVGDVTIAILDSLRDDAVTVAMLGKAFTVYGSAEDDVFFVHDYSVVPIAAAGPPGEKPSMEFLFANPKKLAVTVDVEDKTGLTPEAVMHVAGVTHAVVPFEGAAAKMFKSVNLKFHVGTVELPMRLQFVPQPVPKSVTPAKIDLKVRYP